LWIDGAHDRALTVSGSREMGGFLCIGPRSARRSGVIVSTHIVLTSDHYADTGLKERSAMNNNRAAAHDSHAHAIRARRRVFLMLLAFLLMLLTAACGSGGGEATGGAAEEALSAGAAAALPG